MQQHSCPDQPTASLGKQISHIADQLKHETKIQIHATAQILGVAAQLSLNQDYLIDEVVEMVEADLDAPTPDVAFSKEALQRDFKTFAQAKMHYGLKARSWTDLAQKLNAQRLNAQRLNVPTLNPPTLNPTLPSSPVPHQASTPLIHTLQSLNQRGMAVFCTPGHTLGQGSPSSMIDLIGSSPFAVDFPDLPGLNLYEPDGAIALTQSLAAQTFGAERTWFLINGSTVGILASILATCGPGESIIVPRNSHRSVISGLILSGAHPIFLNPEYDPQWDLAHCITPESVAATLAAYPQTKAILMVSPTYYGVCGDVGAIAALAHDHNIPLIVDEAHGAHFGFHGELPQSALHLGADLVVQSTHKTLGALTQSSMLHLQGHRVSATRITQALQLLQSSSPSNVLLASLEGACHQMATQGNTVLSRLVQLAHQTRQALQSIERLSVLSPEQPKTPGFCALDLTRLTIDVSGLGLDGFDVDTILTDQFGIIAELPTQRHLTFILKIGNTPADLNRLLQAFATLAQGTTAHVPPKGCLGPKRLSSDHNPPAMESGGTTPALCPRDAFWSVKESVSLVEAIGRISGETLCPYPPGIPILISGERITQEAIDQLQQVHRAGGLVTGCTDTSLQTLQVI